MGEVLAEAAGRVYRETVESSEVWKRVLAGGGLEPVSILEVLGLHARATQAAISFLAMQVEDPEPDDVGDAMLESLRAFIATEPAG